MNYQTKKGMEKDLIAFSTPVIWFTRCNLKVSLTLNQEHQKIVLQKN